MIGLARPPDPGALIYLDHQATTPTDPRVVERMLPWFTDLFGNAHSGRHAFGLRAEAAVEAARAEIAALIGAYPKEVIFTSGATEANNLALKAVMAGQGPKRRHLIVSAVEHSSILTVAAALARAGCDLTILPVGPGGLVDPDGLAAAITDRTGLVSVMAVNNEIGVIQPLAEIGAICRAHGIPFHTDAAQAAGKIPLDVRALGIDLLSLSGHKLYGPMGIGALHVGRSLGIKLEPLFHGGDQERGLRPGTLPTPLCVGLGAACALSASEMAEEAARLTALNRRFLDRLRAGGIRVGINGDRDRRVPGNLNLCLPGIDADALLDHVEGVALSTGAACASASRMPSHVLRAIGLSADAVQSSIRIGFGRFTTEEEVDRAVDRLIHAMQAWRDGTPVRNRRGALS